MMKTTKNGEIAWAPSVDADEDVASDRLMSRVPDAQIWMRRVGSRIARRFGGRGKWIEQ
jgi:hypothetical protein